ncbi:hypothetical protein [Sulfurimonas sp. HSL3-7]|uniref:hypothetical protein n=1 Tax=Sulfonitrofixus jiaomeiensis TaxID=3131938 RepID=UPI0031F9B626
MFWFVFISIILFIIFLIVILVSSKSSNDKTLKRLKEELEAKNRGYEKQKTPEKIKPKQAKPLRPREEPKVKEALTAAAAAEALASVEETALHGTEQETLAAGEIADAEVSIETDTPPIASAEEAFIQEEEPSVAEEAVVQDEVAAGIIEEVAEENNEVVSTEIPSLSEDIEESSDAVEVSIQESVEEPEDLSTEELTSTVEPVAEERAVEEVFAEAQTAETNEPSTSFAESFITEEEESQPTAEVFIEEEAAAEAEEELLPKEPFSEEPESMPEEIAEDTYNYPPFDNTRAMEEFGLPKEDADEFIVDLIQQIEEEMPALEVAVQAQDNKQIENISHMIKGSATNLGTGGAADVLIDFNTYMKTGNDPLVIAGHMRNLHRSLAELKEQFQ